MAGVEDFAFAPTPAQAQPVQQNEGIALPQSSTAPVLSPTSQQTFGNALTYGLPAVGTGLIDTLGQSLHVFHNDTVPNALKSFTGDGADSFGDFYSRNQAPLRASGEIAGMFLPGLAAMKALKSVNGLREAGSIGAWAKNSTALDVLLGNSADMAAAEKNITSSTTDAVKAQGIWAGRTISTPAVTAAKRTFYAKKAVEAARATTAFELGNLAAFNSSQIFYPADATLTDQIKWAGAGYAIGGALEMATARYAVRSLTQAAIKEAGPIALDELSPVAKTADSVLFRPGKRGVGVTAYATMNADLNDSIAVNTNPATLKTNLYQDQVNINGIIKKQIDSMAYDTHEFIPRTSLSDEQKDVALKALTKNPTSLLFATKIGTLPGDGMVEFYGEISKTLGKAKDKLSFDTLTASTKFGDKSPEFFKAQSENLAKIEPIQKAADEVHYVLEPTGEWTTYKNRADNWLDNQAFKDIKYKKYETPNPANQEENLKNYKLMAKGTNDITLHDDGRFELPSSPTPLDYSAAYAMGSKLIKDFKPVEGKQLILTPGVNWRQLEVLSTLAKSSPEAAAQIKFGGAQPVKSGFTRFFRGGPSQAGAQDTFDVSTNAQYASQYGELHYTDVPNEQLGARGFGPNDPFKTPVPSTFKLPGNTQFQKFDTGGFSSLDDVDFHILNQKFKEFQTLMPNTATPPITKSNSLLARIASLKQNFTPAQIIQRLNLPVTSGMADSPVVEMFAHAKLQGMKDLNEMFPKPNGGNVAQQPYTQMDLVKQHLREIVGETNPKVEVPFQGNLLKQTTDVKPLFVAATSTPMMSAKDANIITRVQAMRDVQMEKLSAITPQQSPLVSGILQKVISGGAEGGELSGAAQQARAVQTLQDGVLSGTGQTVYQERINEQFAALKGAQLMAQDTDKFTSSYVGELAKANLTPRFATILASKNKSDLLDFNRIEQSYRHGWEIAGKEAAPNGQGYVFRLEPDSQINQKLLAEHFPETDPAEVIHMPDMSVTAKKAGYTPLTISKNAGDLAQAISDMSIQSGKENNVLRTAIGHNPIQLRNFHLPTPELNKEGTWFVYNPQSRVVATYTGPNFKQNEQRAKDAATTLGQGHTAVPLETVKQDYQQNDDNFFSLIDYSDQLAKTGAGIKGGLAHTEIDTGPVTLKAMVKSLEEQFLNVGIRSRAAIFEPELNYAKQAAQTATVQTRNNSGGINIFDRYIATMFSQAPKAAPANAKLIQGIYGKIESGLDRQLSWMNSYFSDITGSESTKAGAKVLRTILRKQTSEEEFAQFEKTLPEWSPFKDAEAWRESTFKEQTPITARKYSSELAKVSSTMSLRFLDFGTAINNFAGLLTNAPSVVTALRRLPNESHDEWLTRTAAWGTKLTDGVVTFSPMKAMNNSIKALWSGELTPIMKDAAQHGYFKPEYSALAEALTLPEKPSQRAVENFIKHASYAADKSETLSRQIAWGMGYKIGKDLHGFDDDKNAYIFANNFVNEMIGNYSPNNKPAMFQGAVGLPLGSFQTYMFNFYRRMYGYVEKGDKASIMAQYAAQASIFGARSVPGYGLWNSFFFNNQATGDDFTGRVRREFAPGVGDLLLNGSLSNIPKIWGGMQGNGLAFYTRGSVDFTQPVPTLLDMSKAPPMQFLNNVAKGVSATANNFLGAGGFSLQQQEEIMANFSTNRALKSIMELAADAKTTQRGQVIEQGTRDAMHVAAALLGTQTTKNRALVEAYNRQQAVQLTQEDLRSSLTAHTRSLLRGGEFDTSDLQSIVHDYLNSGGNPAYLGQWFRNTLMTATEPRTQKQLQTLAQSGKMLEFEDMLATLQQNQAPANKQQPIH